MISHIDGSLPPLPPRCYSATALCLRVCGMASGRPSKTAVAAWEMECAMSDHGGDAS